VGVHGRLDLERWSAQDGTPRRAHRVVAMDVEFLDRPRPLAADEPAA
jgi:single-stranded DNA-binding protein